MTTLESFYFSTYTKIAFIVAYTFCGSTCTRADDDNIAFGATYHYLMDILTRVANVKNAGIRVLYTGLISVERTYVVRTYFWRVSIKNIKARLPDGIMLLVLKLEILLCPVDVLLISQFFAL